VFGNRGQGEIRRQTGTVNKFCLWWWADALLTLMCKEKRGRPQACSFLGAETLSRSIRFLVSGAAANSALLGARSWDLL
jgi:hypothetical protein